MTSALDHLQLTQFDPSSNKLFERHLHAETRSHLYPGYDSADRLLQYQRGQYNTSTGPIVAPCSLLIGVALYYWSGKIDNARPRK